MESEGAPTKRGPLAGLQAGVASGRDVANVSKYAGTASPTITLDRYAREFNAREGDDDRVGEVTAGVGRRRRQNLNLRQLAENLRHIHGCRAPANDKNPHASIGS